MMLLACCLFALLSSPIAAKPPVSVAVSQEVSKATCDENETACGSRCCPHPNAVCCPETQSCCQQGHVCLGSIPYCLGMKTDDRNRPLISEKATALKVLDCPSGTTTCAGGCCPLSNAVCCPDEVTCCPDGYACGPIGSGVCEKDGVVSRLLKTVVTKLPNGSSPNPLTAFHSYVSINVFKNV